jgi:hypothetical protein
MPSLYEFEDLSIFFDDFGQSLTWGESTFLCLFDRKHDPLAFGAGGRSIAAVVQASQVDGISQGETVVISSESFTVAEIQPIQDGQVVKLILEESDG